MKKSDKEINFSDVTVKIQTDELDTDFFVNLLINISNIKITIVILNMSRRIVIA